MILLTIDTSAESASAIPTAVELCRFGGIVVYDGIKFGSGGTIQLDGNAFHFKRLQLRGVHSVPNLGWPQALDLLESYGERLGQKLLNDELDQAQFVTAPLAPGYRQPEPTDLLKPQPSRPSSLPLWLVMGGSLIGLWRQLRKH